MALIAGHYEKVRALAATSRVFAVGGVRASDKSRLTVYDYTTNKPLHEIDVPAHVLGVVIAAGDAIATACSDGFVRVFTNGAETRKFMAHRGSANGIALLGTDRLATVGSDGALRLWSLAGGQKLKEYTLSGQALRAVAADPAGEYVAGAGDDGVVRSVHLGSELIRAMSGHMGPVRALAFTPRDGRVASAGDDGTIRIWYLVGDVEFEVRGGDGSGHEGAILALLFPPTPPNPQDGSEPIDRFYTAGSDGMVKAWRLETKIRPKTLDCGGKPIHALCFMPLPAPQPASQGSLLAAGDARTIRRFTIDNTGNPAETSLQYGHGFDAQSTQLTTGQRPARETAVRTLAALEERESLDLLLKSLATDKEPEVRLLVARELGERGRRAARPKLREALDDGHPTVRAAAFDALLLLDRESPLLPLRHALASKYPEVRIRALGHLVPLRESSPLVPGLIADKLVDAEPTVRVTALEQLSALHPASSPEPLRLAYERGPADLKIEVLIRAAYAGLLGNAAIAPLVARALDDADPGVRRTAYTLKVLDKRALASTLEPRDEDLARSVLEIMRRGAQLRRKKAPAPPTQPTVVAGTLAGSTWEGSSSGYKFTLVFEKAANGVLEGYQDWATGHRAAIKGTYKDQDLEFVDHTLLRGDAGSFNLGDKKIARISGDQMNGTDGGSPFSAVRKGAAAQPRAAVAAVPEATPEEIKAARESLPGSGTAGAALGEADLDPVLTAMACRTPDTALRGARGLAALGDMRALGALLQLSREADANLRREAATALSLVSDPRAKKRLIWMLDDADAAVRGAALDSYSRLEASAPLKPAEVSLRSAHEDIRVRGLNGLVKVGAAGGARPAEADTLLGDALEDESQKVRGEAFRTLWSWHQADPQTALDRALMGRFPDLRLRAIQELETRAKENTWAMDRLKAAIADRDAGVAAAAYNAVVKIKGKAEAEAHVLAMGSIHVTVRALGAKAAEEASADAVRPTLTKLLQDEKPEPRMAALETLDRKVKTENGPLLAALQSGFYDLKVRAGELLAIRHDVQLIDAMQAFVLDLDLFKRRPDLIPLRHRAASALATLGSPKLVKWFATVLLKDEDPQIREQAARGMANSARRGDEGDLLDALGHADAWVRSWAADGLSRLGDARALPVLTGNLRHEHPPIREGAILSFVALGPDGYGGMLQGLEDPSRELQERVFVVILARDLAAFRKGLPPDILTSALSSQRAEVRFSAARALELRTEPEGYLGHLIDLLMPPKPEKVGDMKDWPAEETRERILVGLADALAGDQPEQRYAAAQVLRLQRKPIDYFREASAVGSLRASEKPWVPDTTPRGPESTDLKVKAQRLRKLFTEDPAATTTPRGTEITVSLEEQARLKRLAFGAYVGLLRQIGAQDDETNRVRRDAIDRIVELCVSGSASKVSALPPLQRALDDPNHMVRRSAFSGLKKLYETEDKDLPLTLALASTQADVAKSALDELAARGEPAKSRIAAALNSGIAEARRYAFDLLEKLSPAGSLDPLLAALSSDHADLRLGVVERLAASNDARVIAALSKAMESDHEDLRLRAAELLAQRKDEHAIPVLAAFLRSENDGNRSRAVEALQAFPVAATIAAFAARIEELSPLEAAGAAAAAKPDEKATTEQNAAFSQAAELCESLGHTHSPDALEPLAARFADETEAIRDQAFDAAIRIATRRPKDSRQVIEEEDRFDPALMMRVLPSAARSRHALTRAKAAESLRWGDDGANDVLVGLFTDRDVAVRTAAVTAYSGRVQKRNAPVGPLDEVLRGGARELMLPAAEGVATKNLVSALRPLLLFARAGEGEERPRAILALGTLGDLRALEEIELIAAGGTVETPAEPDMQAAAVESLGRMFAKITEMEAKARVQDRIEKSTESTVYGVSQSAVRALGFVGGERSRTRIESILGDDRTDSSVQSECVKQLDRIADPASEQVLAKALKNYDSDVYEPARRALEKIFPKERARVEIHCALSGQSDLSEPAVEWLANEGDPAAIVPRLPELEDDDLRKRLRWGLIRRGAIPAPELAKLLERKEPEIRTEAAAIIGTAVPARLKEKRPITEGEKAALAAGLVPAERRAAETWAKTAPDDREPEEGAWRMILWAASEIGSSQIAANARQILAAGDAGAPPAVRREAARALARVGGAADVEPLVKALGDTDSDVRVAAVTALAKLAPDRVGLLGGRPVDLLAFGLTADRASDRRGFLTSPDGWRFSLPALLAKGDVEQLASLARTSTDSAIRLDAIGALGRLGGKPAEDVLEEIRKATANDEATRKAAYKSLRRAQRSEAKKRTYAR